MIGWRGGLVKIFATRIQQSHLQKHNSGRDRNRNATRTSGIGNRVETRWRCSRPEGVTMVTYGESFANDPTVFASPATHNTHTYTQLRSRVQQPSTPRVMYVKCTLFYINTYVYTYSFILTYCDLFNYIYYQLCV